MCGSTTPEFALEDDIKVLTILGIREAISNDNMNALSEYDRIKKMIYGEYIKEYNDITEISRMFLSDFMKGLDSFDYLEEIDGVDIDFVSQVLKQYFVDDKMVLSVVY